ncbi:uncharacterized protein LOC110428133 isoform X1 [Herrania umbratica]|uniref:Uncharacterized protein LOC110428133 isoform X1 n=2 Tax=Herrania umbratica TaxID=108875 RepID=A0A6J1BJS8_9ROSI|nr:uncharacterized protein LOC110428133 isoform X1 [Herrania umbratica]
MVITRRRLKNKSENGGCHKKELSSLARMAVSFKYWDDCIDPQDMEEMWKQPEVRTEWIDAGETQGQRVHLSRDPDGQSYLTQTEMRAVAEIVTRRHFHSQIEPEMICSIADLESNRRPLSMRYDKKSKVTTIGIMQIAPKTAEWMFRECDYSSYPVEEDPNILCRPFVNVYFGAAYLEWLSKFDDEDRTEEFIVRAYRGGTKKASHKSTLPYWKRYLSVKESFVSRKHFDGPSPTQAPTSPTSPVSPVSPCSGVGLYWDVRVSSEDMEQMWNHPEVSKEWTKSKERRGKVRFSYDKEKKPYLSRIELKAIAEIIVSKYFSTRGIKPTVLCALAEMVSMRFVDGIEARAGIMGIDYSTAFWLYTEVGYRAYRVDYVEDLTKPFVSMYFGTAYFAWLSEYEGRERTPQFVVQAYLAGPKNVNLQETGLMWLKFEQVLSSYEPRKRNQESCTIL